MSGSKWVCPCDDRWSSSGRDYRRWRNEFTVAPPPRWLITRAMGCVMAPPQDRRRRHRSPWETESLTMEIRSESCEGPCWHLQECVSVVWCIVCVLGSVGHPEAGPAGGVGAAAGAEQHHRPTAGGAGELWDSERESKSEPSCVCGVYRLNVESHTSISLIFCHMKQIVWVCHSEISLCFVWTVKVDLTCK